MIPITPFRFLTTIFPQPLGNGQQIMVCSEIRRSGRTLTTWCFNRRTAGKAIEKFRNTRDVRFGIALQNRVEALAASYRRGQRPAPARARGTEATAIALPALWAEVGVAGPDGARGRLPPDRAAARSLLAAAPRPPSIVVWTGVAYEVYWLLDELWVLERDDDGEDRRRAKTVLRKAQWALAKAAAAEGWRLDHRGDLAALMHLPDTFRHRGKERFPVVVEQFPQSGEDARRWPVSDFEALEEPPAPEPLPEEEKEGAAGVAAGEPAAGASAVAVPRSAAEEPTPAAVPPTAAPRERARIVVTGREDEVNAQALAAIAAGAPDRGSPGLFVRGGVLVEVLPGEPAAEETPRAAAVQEARLREILAERCDFVAGPEPGTPDRGEPDRGEPDGDADRSPPPVRPPRWCTRAILGRGRWPELPRLAGVVETPVLRADGSLLEVPGYDRATGLFYAPCAGFEPVPGDPDDGDVEAALALLRETVCDFPFAGEVPYAAWLAALLTTLARPAFKGPSPLTLVEANRRGAGKSLLADVASVILTGRPAPRLPHHRGGDEVQRAITELALEGARMALYDNATGTLGSDVFARALTTRLWRDRLPGAGARLELPLELSWWVTSNGVTLHPDLPRRTIRILLTSEEEFPDERTGFRHPLLLSWVGENRGRIVAAALTLLRAYAAAGRPPQDLPGMGSFEEWSALVRSAVVFHGLPDPASARMSRSQPGAPEAGAESETSTAFARGVEELLAALGGRATARQMVEALTEEGKREAFGVLRAALRRLYPELGGGLPTARQLGYTLRSFRGREVGGRRIVQARKNTRGVTWSVRKTGTS